MESDFKEKLFHIIEAKAKSDYMADTYRLETGYNFILFKMHAKGIGTKKSPQVAFNCLIEMAKHQSFTAAIEIIFSYRDGNPELDIKPDKEKMIDWCFKTAEYGCPTNLYFLALQASGKKVQPFYDLGISKSLPLAVKCLEKLNEDINIVTNSILDLETFIGNTTQLLYDDISTDLKLSLVNSIEEGLLSDSDYPHLKIATPHLINLLETVYLEMKDYKSAIKNFERTISFDSLAALMNLSNMYRDGLGIDQDNKIAFILKKKVADLVISGYANDWWDLSVDEENKLLETLYEVAESYHHGIGVKQSLPNAAKYYNIIKNSEWTLHIPEDFKEQLVQRATDALSTIHKSD